MAQQIALIEEVLVVPAKGTAQTADKSLIVGCTYTYATSAAVTAALRTGQEEKTELDPGCSITLCSSEHRYRITLLSVNHDEVHVLVGVSAIEKPGPTEGSRSRVSVVETTKSCFAELGRIVAQAIPDDRARIKSSPADFRIVEKGFFGSNLLKISSQNTDYLFHSGRWNDLKIEVFSQPYLVVAQAIADAYAARTTREVVVVKEF